MLPKVLTDYQAKLDKNELTVPKFGMLDQFKSDTNRADGILSQDDKDKIQNQPIGRTVEIPVMQYTEGDYTLTSGKPNTFSPAYVARDSAVYTVSYVDNWFPITMGFGEHQNNKIKYADKLSRELMAWDKAVAKNLNAQCVTAANSAKTQAVTKTFGATFNATDDLVNFTLAEEDRFWGKLSRMHSANDLNGSMTIVGNEGVGYRYDVLGYQGANNDKNLEIQRAPWNVRTDNSITDAASKQATGYAMIDGNTAILHQTGAQFKAGLRSTSGKEWGTGVLPLSGAQFGVVYSSDGVIPGATVTDYQNNPLDLQETWIFWVRNTVITAYNSAVATRPSPIIKFDIADS